LAVLTLNGAVYWVWLGRVRRVSA